MATGDATKKKAPTNSDALWEAFLKNVDTELSNIYTQKVAVVKAETKEMGEFIKSEDTLFAKAIELGGPLPYHKLPNWQEILSTDPDHPGVFYTIIYKVLSEKDATGEISKVTDANLIQILHDAFEESYGTLKPSNEEDFIDWVGTTIINSEDAIPVSLQIELMTGLNKLVFGAKDLKKAPWNVFEKAADPDKKGDKATGIWPEKFEPAISTILNDTGKEERDIRRDTMRVINKLRATESSYNPSTEAAARSWVEGSITGMKTDKILDNERKEDLIASLEDEITQLFPQPDKSYFYSNFQGILYQNIFSPRPMDQKFQALLSDIAKQEELVKQAEAKENEDKEELGGKNGGKNGKDTKQTPKPAPTPAPAPAPPKHPSLTGVKEILDNWFDKNDKSVDKKAKKELENSISKAIQSALSYSFDGLVEQGSQGALLTATYNRQAITRIVDYISNLLNDLNNDLDKDIPANKKESLKAAQNITSAAVAYREFAESLLEMYTSFQDEPNSQQKPNYNKVAQKMAGTGSSNGQDNSIPGVAQRIYKGVGKPEPQVKIAESNGVQVAAYSAGLETSLQRLLNTDQQAALASLKELDSDALTDYNNRLDNFKQDVTDYFTSLTSYIQDRQAFEMDHVNSEIIQEAMDKLGDIASNYSTT